MGGVLNGGGALIFRETKLNLAAQTIIGGKHSSLVHSCMKRSSGESAKVK